MLLGPSAVRYVYDTSVPPSGTFKFLAQDSNSSSHFWVASSTGVYHSYYFGGLSSGATEPLRTDLSGINGMTADYYYVYLSMSDGTIRRISATSL